MPVGELVGAVAQGTSQELVTQADAEEGDARVEYAAQETDLGVGTSRVTGAVGEQDTIRPEGKELGESRGLRQNVDTYAALSELPRGAGLDAQVDGGQHRDRLVPLGRSGGLNDVAGGSGHLGGQGTAAHGRLTAHGLQADVDAGLTGATGVGSAGRQGLTGEDAAAHGACLTQMPGQGPGVDLAEADNAGVTQIVLQLAAGAPAGSSSSRFAYDVAGNPDTVRLGVLVVDPGVTDVWRGLHDDLAVVGGIGQCLLVPGHTGGEDDLSNGAPLSPVAAAPQGPAVLQYEEGGWAVAQLRHEPSLRVSRRERRSARWDGRGGRWP